MPDSQATPRRRAVLGIGLLLALGVVGLAAWQIDRQLRAASVATNQGYLKVAVEDRHVVIEQFLAERLNMLKVLARAPGNTRALAAGEVSPLLAELSAVYADYVSFASYHPDGQRLGFAGEENVDTESVADQDWFTTTLQRGEFVSPLYLGPGQIPTLAMAVRASSAAGDLVVRTTLTLASLNGHLAEMVAGESGGTYMVDPISGSYLSHPYFGGRPLQERSPRFSWGEKHFHVDYDEHGIEEVDATLATRADGTQVIEAHCCTRQGNWLVVVERELDEILAADRALRHRVSATFATALLALVLIALLAWRLLRDPERA
jgi:hypothetical protein